MATYSTIKGLPVQALASDPAITRVGTGTWASGGALNTGRSRIASCGTPTTGLAIAGVNGGGVPQHKLVEQYNGTGWTEITDLNQEREAGAAATNSPATSTVYFGGNAANIPGQANHTESWNGTSWTETANLNDARSGLGGAGISNTSALAFGGEGGVTANTESWNGTAWTEVADLNTAKAYVAGVGINTSAFCIGGQIQSPTTVQQNNTEIWNGVSWSEAATLNSARDGSGAAGTTALAILYGGGYPWASLGAKTETYDGSTWAEQADLSTARGSNPTSIGTQTAAVCGGGQNSGGKQSVTEEWTVPSAALTFAQEGQVWYNTTSNVLKGFGAQGSLSWASGANLTVARQNLSGAGSGSSSGLAFGGKSGPTSPSVLSETYDGSSWAEGGDLNQARMGGAGFGTVTAALFVAGLGYPTATVYTNTETYNGTAWTAAPTINVGRGYLAGCGTTTAGLAIGGYKPAAAPPPGAVRYDIVEDFNGTSWTEVGDLATPGVNSLAAAVQGTPTAALAFSGYSPGGPNTRTEEYNGTSWTEVGDLNTSRANGMGSGTSTAALAIGGEPPALTNVESWNGSSWTETSYDLGSGRYWGAACGSATSALTFGGNDPTLTATTEILAAAPAIKTFTSS